MSPSLSDQSRDQRDCLKRYETAPSQITFQLNGRAISSMRTNVNTDINRRIVIFAIGSSFFIAGALATKLCSDFYSDNSECNYFSMRSVQILNGLSIGFIVNSIFLDTF